MRWLVDSVQIIARNCKMWGTMMRVCACGHYGSTQTRYRTRVGCPLAFFAQWCVHVCVGARILLIGYYCLVEWENAYALEWVLLSPRCTDRSFKQCTHAITKLCVYTRTHARTYTKLRFFHIIERLRK